MSRIRVILSTFLYDGIPLISLCQVISYSYVVKSGATCGTLPRCGALRHSAGGPDPPAGIPSDSVRLSHRTHDAQR